MCILCPAIDTKTHHVSRLPVILKPLQMKPFIPLLLSFIRPRILILPFLMTLVLCLFTQETFAQPCSSCNSCSGGPISPSNNPNVEDPCEGFDIVLVLDESWSISQISGGEQAVEDAVLAFLGAVNCGNLRVAVMQFRTEAYWVFEQYKSFSDAFDYMDDHFSN